MPYLEGHTAHSGVRSFPWSSAGMAPCQRASVLQKTDAEIRLSWAGVSCTGASEDSSACNLVTQWVEQTSISAKYPRVPLDTEVQQPQGLTNQTLSATAWTHFTAVAIVSPCHLLR